MFNQLKTHFIRLLIIFLDNLLVFYYYINIFMIIVIKFKNLYLVIYQLLYLFYQKNTLKYLN